MGTIEEMVAKGLLYPNPAPVTVSCSWAEDIKEIAKQLKRIADALEKEDEITDV